MDHYPGKIKKQHAGAAPPRPPAAAEAAAKKKPTTLLDAYEVECIRRELQQLVHKHNHSHQSSAASGNIAVAVAPTNTRVHHRRHDNHPQHQRIISSGTKKATSAKRVSRSPSLPRPTPPSGPGRRGVRLLGRHAVAICSGTVPVAGAPIGGRGRRAVVICGGGAVAPVACAAAVGVGGRRRPPGGGYREVEVV